MLKLEKCVKVPFNWQRILKTEPTSFPRNACTEEYMLHDKDLELTGIHLQDRIKRYLDLNQDLRVFLSYDTGHWQTPDGQVASLQTCQLGFEINILYVSRNIFKKMQLASKFLLELATIYTKNFPLSKLRTSKYSEYLQLQSNYNQHSRRGWA